MFLYQNIYFWSGYGFINVAFIQVFSPYCQSVLVEVQWRHVRTRRQTFYLVNTYWPSLWTPNSLRLVNRSAPLTLIMKRKQNYWPRKHEMSCAGLFLDNNNNNSFWNNSILPKSFDTVKYCSYLVIKLAHSKIFGNFKYM